MKRRTVTMLISIIMTLLLMIPAAKANAAEPAFYYDNAMTFRPGEQFLLKPVSLSDPFFISMSSLDNSIDINKGRDSFVEFCPTAANKYKILISYRTRDGKTKQVYLKIAVGLLDVSIKTTTKKSSATAFDIIYNKADESISICYNGYFLEAIDYGTYPQDAHLGTVKIKGTKKAPIGTHFYLLSSSDMEHVHIVSIDENGREINTELPNFVVSYAIAHSSEDNIAAAVPHRDLRMIYDALQVRGYIIDRSSFENFYEAVETLQAIGYEAIPFNANDIRTGDLISYTCILGNIHDLLVADVKNGVVYSEYGQKIETDGTACFDGGYKYPTTIYRYTTGTGSDNDSFSYNDRSVQAVNDSEIFAKIEDTLVMVYHTWNTDNGTAYAVGSGNIVYTDILNDYTLISTASHCLPAAAEGELLVYDGKNYKTEILFNDTEADMALIKTAYIKGKTAVEYETALRLDEPIYHYGFIDGNINNGIPSSPVTVKGTLWSPSYHISGYSNVAFSLDKVPSSIYSGISGSAAFVIRDNRPVMAGVTQISYGDDTLGFRALTKGMLDAIETAKIALAYAS